MNGDFETFFRENLTAVTSFLIRSGAGRIEAEDAVQEAMVLAYRSWSTIRHPRAWVRLVSWRLYTASGVKVDEVADTRRSDDLLNSLAVDDLFVLLGDEQRRVVAALRRLPLAQRVVMAWYYDGYRPWEIALILGKPASTVRSDLRFARSRLRHQLSGDPATRARWPELAAADELEDRAGQVNSARNGCVTEPAPEFGLGVLDGNSASETDRTPSDIQDIGADVARGDVEAITIEEDQR
jgi:RNA polymerase sigma-70 factor (ECF subfamily)